MAQLVKAKRQENIPVLSGRLVEVIKFIVRENQRRCKLLRVINCALYNEFTGMYFLIHYMIFLLNYEVNDYWSLKQN